MGTPVLAFGGHVAFGFESSWGVEATLNRWLPVRRVRSRRRPNWVDVEDAGRRGVASYHPRRTVQQGEECELEIEWYLSYDDASLCMLELGLGKVATTGSYTHTFEPGVSTEEPVGMSVAHVHGDGTINDTEVFSGFVAEELSVSIQAPNLVIAKIRGPAKTATALEAAPTPTFNDSNNYVHAAESGNVVWSAGSLNDWYESAEFVFRNPRARRPQSGAHTTARPHSLARHSSEVRVTREWDLAAIYAAHQAGTESDLTIAFDGPSALAMTLTLHNALLRTDDHPPEGRGIVKNTLLFRGRTDGTNRGSKLVVINTSASSRAA
jgi:hypothetical protein